MERPATVSKKTDKTISTSEKDKGVSRKEKNRESELIEALRLPLILLVLFIHIDFPARFYSLGDELTSVNLYEHIAKFFSFLLGITAVPGFFFISGYLYFLKMKEFSFQWYREQQSKRISTLLIPFLLWNTLFYIASVAIPFLFYKLGIRSVEEWQSLTLLSPLQAYWTNLVSPPMWYLRDLMVMTLLSPAFYYMFRYLGAWALLLFAIYFVSPADYIPLGAGSVSILFFGMGAFFGLRRLPFATYISKYGRYITFVTLPLMLWLLREDTSTIEHYYSWINLSTILGMAMLFYWVQCAKKFNLFQKLATFFAPAVFFVYGVHEEYILGWIRGFYYRLPWAHNGWGMIFNYFAIAITILGICYVIFAITKRFFPRVLALLNGGRI